MEYEIQKWRKKPVVIEAMKYDGTQECFMALRDWGCPMHDVNHQNGYSLYTKEGVLHPTPGCYIIKGIENEFYPCDSDIFAKTYDRDGDSIPVVIEAKNGSEAQFG